MTLGWVGEVVEVGLGVGVVLGDAHEREQRARNRGRRCFMVSGQERAV